MHGVNAIVNITFKYRINTAILVSDTPNKDLLCLLVLILQNLPSYIRQMKRRLSLLKTLLPLVACHI